MALRAQKVNNLFTLNLLLRGGTLTGTAMSTFYGLGGRTLTINSQTCTFSAAATHSLSTVLAEINASAIGTTAGIVTTAHEGSFAFVESTPTSGISIDAGGTANSILSLVALQTEVYATPGGTAPALVSVECVYDNSYLVVTDE